MRVPLSSDASTPPDCPPPAPAPQVPAEPPPAGGSEAAGPGTAGAATAPRWNAAPLSRLLRRARSAVRGEGLRRLRRGVPVSARAGGWGPGRLTLRLTRRARGRTILLARAALATRDAATVTLRLVPTRAGRATLPRRPRIELTLLATFTPPGQPPAMRSVTLTAP
jgi:hypothetical protein